MAMNSSSCSTAPCLWSPEFNYGGERGERGWGNDSFCDPVDLLPSDPFGMNLSGTFSVAIAGLVENHAASSGGYGFGGDFVLPSFDFDSGYSLRSYEYQLSLGGMLSVPDVRGSAEDCSNSGRDKQACVVGREEHDRQYALSLTLRYLSVRDLLSVERVCIYFRNVVQTDTLLWRSIHIDSTLRDRITDNDLMRLAQRGQGTLESLSLVGCSRITDDGLRRVLESNPTLRKLSVPGCVRLSVDGIINNLKAVKSRDIPGITQLRLGRLFSVTAENFHELMVLLGVDQLKQANAHKPRFYTCGFYGVAHDDECALDVELCPRCRKHKVLFDCPAESCQEREHGNCRACDVCIPRCVQCGRCINNSEYEETFFLENLCSSCWQQPTERTGCTTP